MHKITLFTLAVVFAIALAEGSHYVPSAYYTIDAEGHESARVPLRRIRRSYPGQYPVSHPNTIPGANANADAEARISPGAVNN